MKWLKKAIAKAGEGALNNLTSIGIAAFLGGGYLVAYSWLTAFRDWVNAIPTVYVLTPLVLLLIVAGVLLVIAAKQRKQLARLQDNTPSDDANTRFVTHFGVWWKIYEDQDYVEDFPYCPCCEPRKKLVQTEWHPEEKFVCPITKTEIQLFDTIPRNRAWALKKISDGYFGTGPLDRMLYREYSRLKELHPGITEAELTKRLVSSAPLNRIPSVELDPIVARYPDAHQLISYVSRHFRNYRRYIRGDEKPEAKSRN